MTDWSVLPAVPLSEVDPLPLRATYIAHQGDIFISRFKQPLGKCAIYLGEPPRLIVNSNFVPIRAYQGMSPFLLLGILKSPFIAYQLHRLICRGSLIIEMYWWDATSLRLPALPTAAQGSIIQATQRRLDIESQHRILTATPPSRWDSADRLSYLRAEMCSIDAAIDQAILDATVE